LMREKIGRGCTFIYLLSVSRSSASASSSTASQWVIQDSVDQRDSLGDRPLRLPEAEYRHVAPVHPAQGLRDRPERIRIGVSSSFAR
jgi:hypothetical protein